MQAKDQADYTGVQSIGGWLIPQLLLFSRALKHVTVARLIQCMSSSCGLLVQTSLRLPALRLVLVKTVAVACKRLQLEDDGYKRSCVGQHGAYTAGSYDLFTSTNVLNGQLQCSL